MKSTSRNLFRIACLAVMTVLAMTYAGISRSASPAPNSCVTPPSGMIGWWPGDGYPNDLAGTNHGTLQSGVTFAPGKVGQSFSLDGGRHVEVPDNPTLTPNTAITIDAWFTATPTSNYQFLVNKFDHNNGQWDDSYALGLTPSNGIRFQVDTKPNGGNADNILEVPPPAGINPTDGNFHFMIGTYDGTTMRLYIDGVLAGSMPASGPINKTTKPLLLGAGMGFNNNKSYFLRGLLDEVEIFDRALSESEASALYAAGSAGKCKAGQEPPPGSCSTSVNVPGTSNPFLAGMPAGSTDNGLDPAPAHSPVLVNGLPITPGATYTFSATGAVHLGDNNAAPPDGFDWYKNLHFESNGIGGYYGPANALLGVFLDNSAPNTTPAPNSWVNMYDLGFNNPAYTPALKQVFFIGDGKTSLGATQTFVAPAGATRLYLATLDGFGWYNNGGSFNVTATKVDCQNGSCTSDTVLLEDHFDTERGGSGALNYTGFANWTVTKGTVDIIGNGFWDWVPGNGLYVDLDGSASQAGTLESKANFALAPGRYMLQYDIAGSARPNVSDVVSVKLGNVYSESFTLPSNQPFTTITRTITVTSQTSGKLSFEQLGDYINDDNGIYLDDVILKRVCQTPPPAITTGPAENSLIGPGLPGQPGVVRTTFGGTGNAGCTIRATVNDPDHGNVGTYTTVVDASGNWSLDFELHDCDPVIEFVQICDGVESEAVRRHIYVDGTPPEFTGGGPAADDVVYIGGGSGAGTILIDGSAADPNTYHCVGNCGGVTYEWYLIGSGGSRTLLGGGGSGGTLIEYVGGPGSGLRIELGEGEYEFEVVVTDGAGNRLVRRCRRRVVLPRPLTITGGLPEDGGIYGPATGTETGSGRVRRTITGTGNPGCTVNLKVSDPTHPDSVSNNTTYTATVDNSGNWSLDLELDDCHPYVEVYQDCDGSAGEVIRRQIFVDGTPPKFVGGSGPGDDVHYAGGGGRALVTLVGAATDEDTHVVGGGLSYRWRCISCGPGGTDIEFGEGGSYWRLINGGSSLEVDLEPGAYDIEVEVCDTAGNCTRKRCRQVVRRPVTLTSGLPETGGIMGPGTGYTVVGGGGRVRTRLTGRGEPGCTVNLKVSDPTHPDSASNNTTYTVEVDASGNWSLDLELDDCHPVIEIRQVCDGEAGEVIRRQVYIDTTPPTAGLSDQTVVIGAGGTATIVLNPGAEDHHSHVPGNGLSYRWYLVGDGGRTPLCENCPGIYELVRGPGEYFVEVEITDSAGNVTTKRCKVVVLKRPTEILCASNSVDFAGMVTLNYTLKDKLSGEVLVRTIKYKLNGNEVPATFEAYLLPGTYQVVAEFAGDEIYQSCSSDGGGCTLEVRSTPGKITGGGSIDERVRNFGFVVQTKSQGGATIYTGQIEYQDKAAGYNLRSQSVTVIAVSADRRRGLFAGAAVVNGVPGYTFTAWVDDLAEPGPQVDKFRIQISGPGGFAYDSNGHATLEGKLDQGGNIQIHKAN